MNARYIVLGVFMLAVIAFLGGIVGGFLGVGLLDDMLFGRDTNREVILQESSVIIDVAKKLESSVVNIEAEAGARFDIFGRRFEGGLSAGTGVIVSADGIILTNKHVVPEDSRITVRTSNGAVYENVRVIDRDPFNDIAYLQLESDEEFQATEFGDSDQVAVGQRVIAIGNALGEFDNTVTSGIISGIGRPVTARRGGFETEQLQDLFQTDAAINPGNSGGPLVNIEGQVIGINTAVAGNAENIGFAIPINQAIPGLESIQQAGRLIKPFLGVRYVILTPEIATSENLAVSDGAYLISGENSQPVVSGSPAERAGLRPGDVILEINGHELNRRYSLATALNRYRPGENIELTVLRDNGEMKVTVTLDEVPTD